MTEKQKKRVSRKKANSKPVSKPARHKSQALTLVPRAREEGPRTDRPRNVGQVKPSIDPLLGDLPSVTLKDEHEVLCHFGRLDPRLAEAWKRDVAIHKGPITLRRVMEPASFHGATHYAYVDRRLLWYLKHDPTDPLGARWDGYLDRAGDAPSGTIAVFVGRDIVVKKCPPQIEGRVMESVDEIEARPKKREIT